MKLFNALFGGTYQFSEQLVNADKSKRAVVQGSTIVYGENKPVTSSEKYQGKGAWVVHTREEAKVFYPKLIAKQDAALREVKYGATAEMLKRRQFVLVGLYGVTFSTAFYGLYKILTADS